MQRIRALWNAFKTFAVIFSFITNLVLVITLLVIVKNIFIIKNGIAEPLIDGLHGNFVGLDEARIITTISVNDQIPIDFTLPISQTTTVVLQEAVPLSANAAFSLPGGGGTINGTVNLSLPVGMSLPVQLEMDVPVSATIPIAIDVPVNIPLKQTELHDPFVNLRNLFEPFVKALDNLPSNNSEAPDFFSGVMSGEFNAWVETEGSRDPWFGRMGYPRPVDTVKPAPVQQETALPDNTTTDAVPTEESSTETLPDATLEPTVGPTMTLPPSPAGPTATTVPLVVPEATQEPPVEATPTG